MVMRAAVGALLGGTAGFLIGYAGRCASGACPLTSNPVVSALFGVAVGLLLAMGR